MDFKNVFTHLYIQKKMAKTSDNIFSLLINIIRRLNTFSHLPYIQNWEENFRLYFESYSQSATHDS